MNEHIELLQSSRLAAVSAGLAAAAGIAVAIFLLLALKALFRKAALVFQCATRSFRLASERSRNFPGTWGSAFSTEVTDARRIFTIESARMGSFWKRVVQAWLCLLVAAAGAIGYVGAHGLRDTVAYEDTGDLGTFRIEDDAMVWKDASGREHPFPLMPGERIVVVEGEELVFPPRLGFLGLFRHHRPRNFCFYRNVESPFSPGAPDRRVEVNGESPFFLQMKGEPWGRRLAVEHVTLISTAADLSVAPHRLTVLKSGYAFTPASGRRGSVSVRE
jgi:hypothetical protein